MPTISTPASPVAQLEPGLLKRDPKSVLIAWWWRRRGEKPKKEVLGDAQGQPGFGATLDALVSCRATVHLQRPFCLLGTGWAETLCLIMYTACLVFKTKLRIIPQKCLLMSFLDADAVFPARGQVVSGIVMVSFPPQSSYWSEML